MKLSIVVSLLFAGLFSQAVFAEDYASYTPVGKSTADGSRIYLQDPEISIDAPIGWTINHDPRIGLTLRMTGKTEKIKIGRDRYKFAPYFQIKTIENAEAIDDVRAKSFAEHLNKTFGEKFRLSEFQILQQEQVDFKAEKDALIVYTSYMEADLEMMQMHFLVSSDKQQFVVTYTDAGTVFRADEGRQNLAWNIATSIDYEGSPMARYERATQAGIGFGAIIFLLVMLKILRTVKHRKLLADGSAYDEDDDESMDLALNVDRSKVKNNLITLESDDDFDDIDESDNESDNESDDEFDYPAASDEFGDDQENDEFDDFEDPADYGKEVRSQTDIDEIDIDDYNDDELDELDPDFGEDDQWVM